MNAIRFLEAWVTIGMDALRHHNSQSRISDQVRRCQDAAFKKGISENDLDTAANGDVASYLLEAQKTLGIGSEIKNGRG